MAEATSALSVAVHLSGLQSGELRASFGIESQTEVGAEALELRQIERHSDDRSTVPGGYLFALLGASLPVDMRCWQPVAVFHPGLDLRVLLGGVPALRGDVLGRHEVPHA